MLNELPILNSDFTNELSIYINSPNLQRILNLTSTQFSHSLSYHQHIVQLVPQSYAALIPLPPDPIFKYIDELLPGAKLAKQLLDAIRGKSSALAVGGFIEASTDLDDNIKINVMMQTFLHLGSKSFTHIFSIFSKFQPVMKVSLWT